MMSGYGIDHQRNFPLNIPCTTALPTFDPGRYFFVGTARPGYEFHVEKTLHLGIDRQRVLAVEQTVHNGIESESARPAAYTRAPLTRGHARFTV